MVQKICSKIDFFFYIMNLKDKVISDLIARSFKGGNGSLNCNMTMTLLMFSLSLRLPGRKSEWRILSCCILSCSTFDKYANMEKPQLTSRDDAHGSDTSSGKGYPRQR